MYTFQCYMNVVYKKKNRLRVYTYRPRLHTVGTHVESTALSFPFTTSTGHPRATPNRPRPVSVLSSRVALRLLFSSWILIGARELGNSGIGPRDRAERGRALLRGAVCGSRALWRNPAEDALTLMCVLSLILF